ncbi:hypothetical protein GGR52DRAFT_573239 [Hypoxylon sp. FL1284]|nr:hypothetical protein GGR52DRAFT_573239 [Hypoxylon sp. FL1284]
MTSTPPLQTPASGSGSGSMSYPALPASPTLTNPDMILPDYDDPCPSPDRSHSPLLMWKNAHAAEMGFDLTPQAFTGPITPTTPIIYGNGTMLSDIGEVTEVESTCAPTEPRSGSTRSDGSIHPVSAGHYEIIKDSRVNRERRMSMDSTSTITAHEPAGVFADFDDAVSVDDSNFQGDDEESVAESFIDDASVQEETVPVIKQVRSGVGEERYSTALSRRAEHILANAKRRLTTMEGNLSRARTSLYSPTLSADSGSTPSPPIRPATAHHYDRKMDYRKSSHSHNRVSSEGTIPTLPIDIMKPGMYVPRSSSALGAAGGYRPPLQSPLTAEHAHQSTRSSPKEGPVYSNSAFSKSKPSLYAKEHALEPLSEDDASQDIESSRPSLDSAKLDSFLSPTFGSYSDKGLKRSASTAQMKDLKDQMKDLKGRLSTLRDQARADSMKRRSLQSLRTPSPFTHAQVDQWYADTGKYDGNDSAQGDYKSHMLNVDEGDEDLAAKQAVLDADKEAMPIDLPENNAHTKLGDMENNVQSRRSEELQGADDAEEDLDDMKTEDGYEDDNGEEQYARTQSVEQDILDDTASESGASSYYDSVQNQMSHEDRADAFDYEHFFLHSAMGSMSQSRMRRKGSQESFGSDDSVETTRGPVANTSASRRASIGSSSSVESFATATESRTARGESDNAEIYHERGIAIPRRARTHTPNTSRRPPLSTGTSDSGSDKGRSRPTEMRRPQSSAAAFTHRPSVSSMDSGKTHRSFPLVNKPKMNGGMLTPRDSPDRELQQISETILHESFSGPLNGDRKGAPIEMLQREDRILVERLIASLGRCVLGLAESGYGTAEYRSYRRKIEEARQVLESLDESA